MKIIDWIHKIKAPSQPTIQTVYDKYYSDYPELPYISDKRNIQNWLEQMEKSPKLNIIPKKMMTRFSDGLLPGHICMLHWLRQHTNESIPSYFEYVYGIDFEKEKKYLLDQGYLIPDCSKPSSAGEKAIQQHYDVIKNLEPTNRRLKRKSHAVDRAEQSAKDKSVKHESVVPSSDMVDNNLRAIDFEKQGDIDSAIMLYEYNVQHRFEGNHPYDRLAIIYRKRKEYDKEAEVLETAIEVFTHDVSPSRPDKEKKLSKFKERLSKVNELKNKS